ncbi:type III pantothenate kinase [Echinicola marina]|uniref:type III pantothenate kinase n=1 Tax=Echinicola marina TaxID=2859768 RepID=UPI001CF6D0C5|nr:type III pantothenate kinase [Echinicola marina]UCS94480.1 type III pantothenate kinase [Echinicola marina]
MRNLVIDIGNTRIKSALFDGLEMIEEQSLNYIDELLRYTDAWDFDHVIVSSVRWSSQELELMLPFGFLFLDQGTLLPVKNQYQTPHTLGLDRLAAAIGAYSKTGKGPVLSIDLGTCITYDFIDAYKAYLGGAISPGLQMRFRAMHEQTARLPLVDYDFEEVKPGLIGGNTLDGMKSGVYFGIKHEIEGIIKQYLGNHQDLKVFICGGDAKFFESLTKDHIFVIPNLVLHGLNRILIYNVNKN